MTRLLSIEWNKFFYNKGTRIFLILYFLMIVGMGIVLPNIKPKLNGLEIDFIKLGSLEFPVIWHNITWLISFGKFFLAVIVINNISNEYSFGTFKQNVIDGLTKREFMQSKVLMNFLFALISTLFVVTIVVILGAIFSEKFDLLNGIEFIAGYFVEIFAYIVLAMFLTFLLKKSVFAILSLFVLLIGEAIFRVIEFFIRKGAEKLGEDNPLFTSYLPLSSNGKILGFPPGDVTKYLMGNKFFQESHVNWEYFITNIIYIIVFLSLSYLIVKKRDL